jgi:hypothetical protein
MDKNEYYRTLLKISKQYDEIATDIANKAKALRNNEEISHPEYGTIMDNVYKPMMDHASNIVLEVDEQIALTFGDDLKEIEASTEKLKAVADRITDAAHIFKAATFILATTISVASFIAAPTPQTANGAVQSAPGSFGHINALF